MFVSLFDDIDYAAALSCKARDPVVKVLIEDGFQLVWRSTEYWRKEREKV